MFAYLNGQFLPRASATISVEDRGFIFGDGVYEVWRVVNGRLFEIDRHLARLTSGLDALRIARPPLVDRATLLSVAERLLNESGLTKGEASFYVEITRGAAPRSHQFPDPSTPPTVYATVNKFTPPEDVRAQGVACITVPDIRWHRCNIKTIQLLPNVLAKQAAVENGAVDAILVRDGIVTESSHANVFAVLNGVIRTHPTNELILPGVTRAVVIELARMLELSLSEEAVTEAELAAAEEVFLAGTTTDVMPVVSVNGSAVSDGKPGPITMKLFRHLRAHLDRSCGVAGADK